MTTTTNYSKPSQNLSTVDYFQNRFKWTEAITLQISWQALKIRIKRNHRHNLTTKICNGILPTKKILKQLRYCTSNKSSLCGGHENQEHIIRCKDLRQRTWKIKYIKATIQKILKRMKTHPALIDTFCTAVTEWMDKGKGKITNYPINHHNALYSQQIIDWNQIFMVRYSWKRCPLNGKTSRVMGKY